MRSYLLVPVVAAAAPAASFSIGAAVLIVGAIASIYAWGYCDGAKKSKGTI